MKNKIVLVPFPFDDLSSLKVRPAVCLTDEIQPHRHLVVAFSNISSNPAPTDLVINSHDPGFDKTGLKVPSMVRLHRLMTVSRSIVQRELGELTSDQQVAIAERLRTLFGI